MDAGESLEQVRGVTAEWMLERGERQARRLLVARDFEQLAEAGFLRATVPVEMGGSWQSTARSVRPVCDMLRLIAQADSSVALVASMHPVVLSYWLASPEAPEPYAAAWEEQRRRVFSSILAGGWWGTITSEPGSGGEITRTAATARLDGKQYRISGRKQFGSGLGVVSYMITTAIPDDSLDPDWFFVDVRDKPQEQDETLRVVAPWDGHGMIASQSDAVLFSDYPATRLAWPKHLRQLIGAAVPSILCYFSAVFVGIVEVAMETAKRHLATREYTLRSYERVEWARAEMDAWLMHQAFEGMLRAVEAESPDARQITMMGKTAIAELSESVLSRVCRVLGGGTYARYAPYGFWFEDVRALGFLRPPWGLAFEYLFDGSWQAGLET